MPKELKQTLFESRTISISLTTLYEHLKERNIIQKVKHPTCAQ